MKLILIAFSLLLFSCNNAKQENSTEINKPSTTDSATVEKIPVEPKKIDVEPLVADTGQTWFKVSVSRNDTANINYEGTWPVLLTTEGFATLAFTAAKGASVISHGVTFYIYGWPPAISRLPIMKSASKSGEVSLIMVPVVNGSYSLAISPHSGFLEFTESDGKNISGYFEADATNENKDVYRFKGQFLNIRPHGT